MKLRSVFLGAAALCISLSVTGCDTLDQIVGSDEWEKWTPEQTSLQISLGGTVTETIFDTLDESYYDADELQDLIARSVRIYNEEHGENSITVPAYSAQNGKIYLVLTYAKPEDYASYNEVNFFNGSILSAQMNGLAYPDTFLKVNGTSASESVSSEEALSHKEYSIAVADTEHVVQVPGQIRFVSENAEIVNSHTASPKPAKEEEKQEETGLVLPSRAVYYETEDTEAVDADLSSQKESDFFIIYEADSEPTT